MSDPHTFPSVFSKIKMFFQTGRTLEITLCAVVLIMFLSASCVMSRICPSGLLPDEKMQGDAPQKDASISSNFISDSNKPWSKRVTSKPVTTTEETPKIQEKAENFMNVTIYSSINHNGRSRVLKFTDDSCQDLPEVMRNRVQSINTFGQCVLLCDNLNCGGWCVKFAPGTAAHHRFRKVRFHKRAESARRCPSP